MGKVKQSPPPGGVHSANSELILEADKLFDRLALGTWTPNVDLCESEDVVTVRVELPGVGLPDVNLMLHNGVLRVWGLKREPASSQKLLCYYCLERSYGRFDREIRIDWVVDAPKARAYLENGVLTVELPKLRDRRGSVFEIPVSKR